MNVYFVRHGESQGNEKRIHQDSNTKLSNTGIEQAEFLAKRARNIDLDIIVSSNFVRAKQTAQIISDAIDKPIEESELFRERKRPTAIEGYRYDHPFAVEIKSQIKRNYHDPNHKHSDEESFFELKDRAQKAFKYLEQLDKENILVVTHSDFIICMMGVMIFGEKFEATSDLRFLDTFKSKNTGITLCTFTENNWRILSWNDYSHLG